MKKVLFGALVLGLLFTSCKSDDDSGDDGDQTTCQTCDLDILGTIISSEYCDNGDGTMTVTTDGQAETVDLNGGTYADFITGIQAAGATCN